MAEGGSRPSVEDRTKQILAVSSSSRDLQTVYLIMALVVSVGCGLLLIFLVWKKEYLQKPSHYLRCNLAVDNIIFTSGLIPIQIYRLFQQDVESEQLLCSAKALLLAACLVSMLGPVVFSGLPDLNANLQCELEPANSASVAAILRTIVLFVAVLVGFTILVLYYFVLKEARKQQARDESRNMWIFQTNAFRRMAPHAVILAVSAFAFQSFAKPVKNCVGCQPVILRKTRSVAWSRLDAKVASSGSVTSLEMENGTLLYEFTTQADIEIKQAPSCTHGRPKQIALYVYGLRYVLHRRMFLNVAVMPWLKTFLVRPTRMPNEFRS
ncbi:hypothetical protein Bbelb_082720 [Branchiostoma belcheri]|nr:hypothetical protein Bbelb_082720 [Branchiostoma belcheri]